MRSLLILLLLTGCMDMSLFCPPGYDEDDYECVNVVIPIP